MKRKLEIIKSLEIVLAALFRVLANYFENELLLYFSYIGGGLYLLTELIYFSIYKQFYVYGDYVSGKAAYLGVFFFMFLLVFVIYMLITGAVYTN
ncbi:hypothetical protein [Sporohalobacter salinus]|uniref:hypothetical protein n=1 Tax=Sporohalobacter salinus TaxID=1494606 RepID=UPI00195F5A5C|nr:hypothetical protein [Sporohalobacter salinus]MBM7625049.1 hypothetical protein [Sporohalobacter salinus]